MTSSRQTRKFVIDPNAIMSLIKGQAGSLKKAMLEAATNSLDAGASKIDITVNQNKVIIIDDGLGIQTIEEIENYFERFGFNHEGLGRTVGFFGVGRGQLFCFGINQWRTSEFRMSIDVKENGLDYELDSKLKKIKGMQIEIELYTPLTQSEIYTLKNEFRQLVEYFPIPVLFNKTQINKSTEDESWNHEDDKVHIKIKPEARTIEMFSQGHFVQSIHSYKYGVGGTVVTKKGQPFKQNLARNDILTQECDVWKHVEKTIKQLAKPYQEKADKKAFMSPEERRNACLRACEEDGASILLTSQIFTTSNQKPLTLSKVLNASYISAAERRNSVADKLMQRKIAIVLSMETLENFGVTTTTELVERLDDIIQAQINYEKRQRNHSSLAYSLERIQKKLCRENCFFDDVNDIPADLNREIKVIKPKDLKHNERVALMALRKQNRSVAWTVNCKMFQEQGIQYVWQEINALPNKGVRTIHIFESSDANDGTMAFTDGIAHIYINVKTLRQKMTRGFEGFVALINIMIHEYIHTSSSEETHVHGEEFYNSFHDLTLEGGSVSTAMAATGYYVKHADGVTKATLNSIDTMQLEVEGGIGLGVLEDTEEDDSAEQQSFMIKPSRNSKSKKKMVEA